ncbi:MAG: hypothetical protein ABIT20_02555 [Gemmatimonadaceae bacterium]
MSSRRSACRKRINAESPIKAGDLDIGFKGDRRLVILEAEFKP